MTHMRTCMKVEKICDQVKNTLHLTRSRSSVGMHLILKAPSEPCLRISN